MSLLRYSALRTQKVIATVFCHKQNILENKFWKTANRVELAIMPTAKGTGIRRGRSRIRINRKEKGRNRTKTVRKGRRSRTRTRKWRGFCC
jgi:metal-dependent HD superfamily phosphatase/phosphodiesterase